MLAPHRASALRQRSPWEGALQSQQGRGCMDMDVPIPCPGWSSRAQHHGNESLNACIPLGFSAAPACVESQGLSLDLCPPGLCLGWMEAASQLPKGWSEARRGMRGPGPSLSFCLPAGLQGSPLCCSRAPGLEGAPAPPGDRAALEDWRVLGEDNPRAQRPGWLRVGSITRLWAVGSAAPSCPQMPLPSLHPS